MKQILFFVAFATILNAQGMVVKKLLPSKSKVLPINSEGLSNGVYLLHLSDGKNTIHKKIRIPLD